jgi:hypothetical protein
MISGTRLLNLELKRRTTMRRYLDQPVDPPFCEPTNRQQAFLDRHKLNPDHAIDFYDAMHTIGRFVDARRQLSPTVRQEKFLKEKGLWRDGMSRGEAFDLIRQILARTTPRT